MNKIQSFYRSQAIRFCVVGIINTTVTAVVILSLTTYGVGLYLSNATGYVVGVLLSFILNTYFTFSSRPSLSRLFKFILCCIICYVINLISMNVAMSLTNVNKYILQLVGMFFYTTSGFLINKLWVMK